MPITKAQIVQQLRNVTGPAGREDIVSAGMIQNVATCEGFVNVKVVYDPKHEESNEGLSYAISHAVNDLGDEIQKVTVDFVEGEPVSHYSPPEPPKEAPQPTPPPQQQQAAPGAPVSPQQNAKQANPLPNIQHIIAIGAGKGGVGKSTVSTNLAIGLARRGLKVGLLDGDIYGPSAPTMLGLGDQDITGTSQSLNPFEVHGIKVMTIGKLVDPNKPLIWRGPMAHGAFQQLALQTEWGELDYLIIDLPPGTGDVPLTLAQMLPLTGAVIVCTPQKVAQDDAVRAAGMFQQLDINVLGVVENMSYFIGDDGKEYDIFGKGGAVQMAETLGVPVLGQAPINTALRANGDSGNPTANFEGDPTLKAELENIAEQLVDQVEAQSGGAGQPTLTIS
ncbi:MAG: Mrp/NBP35 family ATP-binding protein [Planctomycetota bacterium]|jgi:ATP-binding protein involved in chromosome partitioning